MVLLVPVVVFVVACLLRVFVLVERVQPVHRKGNTKDVGKELGMEGEGEIFG